MKGDDQGAYYHPNFQVGREAMLSQIRRITPAGSQISEDIAPVTPGMRNLSPSGYSPCQFPSSSSLGAKGKCQQLHQQQQLHEMSSLSMRLGYKRDAARGTIIMPSKRSKTSAHSAARAAGKAIELHVKAYSEPASVEEESKGEGTSLKRSLSVLSVSSCDDWSATLNDIQDSMEAEVFNENLFDAFEFVG